MDQRTSTSSLPRAQSRGVFVFISGIILGILVSSFVFILPLFGVLLVFVGIAIWLTNFDHTKEVLLLSLALLSFGLGTLRYSIKDFHEPQAPSSSGIVISEPEQKENTTRFVMKADNSEKVLISTDLYSLVRYGDRVEIKGKLQEPGIIEDENGGRPFDYGKFLSKDEIYFTMSFAEVEIISHEHGNFVKRMLFSLKYSFIGKIKEILTEPESSLLSGLIVAGKAAMPKDILEEFQRAGVIHIVVLSGYNITIIAEFMRTIFRSAKFSIIGVLFFVIMTGVQATVVRASIMVLAVILAKAMRRNFSASRALLVAAFLMVIHNPKILVFDPSFQLSFLATCGLIYISPIVEEFLIKFRMPEAWGLRTILITTVATQTTVLPLLIYSVGNFSLVSLPANILILLFIPITMLVGFLATLVAYLSVIVAWPLSYIAHLLLSWVLGVSHYLGNLSFASMTVPIFSFWWIVIVYLVMIIFVSVRLRSGHPESVEG